MADKGPGAPSLIIKRIEVEVSRLEHSIRQQELQLLEMDDQRERIHANINASHKALAEAKHNLQVTTKQYKEEVENG